MTPQPLNTSPYESEGEEEGASDDSGGEDEENNPPSVATSPPAPPPTAQRAPTPESFTLPTDNEILTEFIAENETTFMEALLSSQHQGIKKMTNKELLQAFQNIKKALLAAALKNSELQGALNSINAYNNKTTTPPASTPATTTDTHAPPNIVQAPTTQKKAIIQAKSGNNTNAVANFIRQSYDPGEFNLTDVEMKVTKDKVIVTSSNTQAITKFKTAIEHNPKAHDLTTHTPTQRPPTFKLAGLPHGLDKDTIIPLLIQDNPNIATNTEDLTLTADYTNPKASNKNLTTLVRQILTDRTISYNTGQTKIFQSLIHGSPQGPPLSPLLWNITITDLLNTPLPDNTSIQAFADDITITVHGTTRSSLEQRAAAALEAVHPWAHNKQIQFSSHKCKFLTIGNKYQTRPPKIKLGNQTLSNTTTLKILGVTFDYKMTFLPHLKDIQQKITTLTTNLGRFTGHSWGMSPKHLRDIYIRAFERIILYASPICGPTSHLLRKLTSIQRTPLLKITKAFRTTPNTALPILANIPPIHLTIEKENALFSILHDNTPFTFSNHTFRAHEIAIKTDLRLLHPTDRIALKHSNEPANTSDLYIYTDGSQSTSGTGAAFVVINNYQQTITTKQIKLHDYTSNFEAEALAIEKALVYIAETPPPRKTISILADSLSTLKGLGNPTNTNPAINNIKTVYRAASQHHPLTLRKSRYRYRGERAG
ncbi:uncharacterized protein LOC144096845 [Amblyomma americanum]